MPNDTLREELEGALRGATDYINSSRPDQRQRQRHLQNLKSAESRLSVDINERNTSYLDELLAAEKSTIDARWQEVCQQPDYSRANAVQKANQKTFEELRQVNSGAFPRNISPVLYVIPLILVGVAEWYVNFSTFATMFIPVIAIAATLIVAAVFAWASHLHGAYLKQISEILHPSVEYRNELGRKIALIIATILLIAAFATVIWLRYIIISDQLGIDPKQQTGTFGGASATMIWSRLGPTIVLNVLIWGLGTLYAWALHEKIPGLRETFRDLKRADRKVDSKLRPFFVEQKRIKAHYDREREKNKVAINEYRTLLEDVKSMGARLQEQETSQT